MAVDYNDEMFEEQDLGADINEKEKLIEEAESLKDETNWNEANRKANQLKKRVRRMRRSTLKLRNWMRNWKL